MSKVEQIEAELHHLSKAELAQLRRSLDDLLEDELEFTPEFEAALAKSEQEKSRGIQPRTRADLAELEALENAEDLKAARDALGDSEPPVPWAQAKAKLDAKFGFPQPAS